MMGPFLFIHHHDEGAFWGNEDEVGIWHLEALPTRRPNLIGNERDSAIKFANGGDDHEGLITLAGSCGKLTLRQAQFGARFSRKAAMPSFASTDSRASM